jgi:phospholipid/cholesterol/gamma-HCH transport system permease protein
VADTEQRPSEESLSCRRLADGTLVVSLAGAWTISDSLPTAEPVLKQLAADPPPARLAFVADGLGVWDSSLLTVLADVAAAARAREVRVETDGLPEGVRALLALATAVPARGGGPHEDPDPAPFLDRLGRSATAAAAAAARAIAFVGDVGLSLGRFVRGRAGFRRSDFVLYVQQAGAEALPIVSLISVLIGMILAFVGSIQLKMFGAQIYVANLVGIAMVREMGAMMTAIIMAGRTGASFAAQLGTMQVNEEIDALRTLGVSPTDFLVLPRILALVLMMPLLTIYANFVGIFGGYVVGVTMLDLSPTQYLQQTLRWIKPNDVMVGLGKSVIFGMIIALCGCFAGIACGRSAAAVGKATTAAVVTAIVWIIVADGIAAVLTSLLRV